MSKRISIDLAVQQGKPVIQGTRVPVARVLGNLACGMTSEEIIDEYGVTTDDIAAALEFATDATHKVHRVDDPYERVTRYPLILRTPLAEASAAGQNRCPCPRRMTINFL